MSVLDLMKKRYSSRKYLDKPVEKEKIDLILEAAVVAPTAANKQPQRIIVLNNQESLEKMRKATTSHHGAPLAMLILGDHSDVWVRPFDKKNMIDIDTSIITTHMMLMATELGLGSCWVDYFDPKIISEEFNLPENLEPVNILVIGYADDTPASPNRHDKTRKLPNETIYYHSID